jgi:glycosyltransferase involved in cell wall biosynthesis
LPEVSIIIPTFNRKEKLRNTLLSLNLQKFPQDRYEVIVVDDGGTDDSDSMVGELKTPYQKRFCRKRNGGPSSARNLGTAMAKGKYVLYLDDDVQATPSLIAEHMKMHGDQGDVIVMGKVLPLAGTGMLIRKMMEYGYDGYHHGQDMEFFAVTANLSVRKSHVDAVGGFNEKLTGVGCEDTEFGFRLISRRGLRLIFNEKALAYHDKTLSPKEAARYQFNNGRYAVWALRHSPGMLSERYSSKYSRDFLSLLHFHNKHFLSYTEEDRNRLLNEIERDEKLMNESPAAEIEASLARNCKTLIDYAFREGFHSECQRLDFTASLFEYKNDEGDPARCLMSLRLRLASSAHFTSCHGRTAQNAASELTRRGFFVSHEPFDALFPDDEKKRIRASINSLSGNVPLPFSRLHIGAPFELRKDSGCYSIGYTTHLTTELWKGWVKRLDSMDELWVPSSYMKKAFQASGVKTPIFIMPLGADSKEFRPFTGEALMELFGHFSFLYVGSSHFSKGLDILIRAYLEEFSISDDVNLILKTYADFHSEKHDLRETLSLIKKKMKRKRYPPLTLIDSFHKSLTALYNRADAYVSTIRGAQFPLSLLEAMACGKPVIANNFGDASDYLTNNNAFLLDYTLVNVYKGDHPFRMPGQWAETSVEHTRSLMRYVYEQKEEALRKSAQARRDFLEKWTLEQGGERMAHRLCEIYRKIKDRKKNT